MNTNPQGNTTLFIQIACDVKHSLPHSKLVVIHKCLYICLDVVIG